MKKEPKKKRDDGAVVVKETGRSWVVAACCFFCNLTFYGVSRLSGIMLVATTHSFNVSRARAAVPFSLSTAVRSLTGVFVGQLGHRFGVGPIVAVGCLIASLGSGLSFFAQDMLWLTVCWGGVFGVGFGFCTCLLPLAINQNFSKHLGTGSGISYSGSYVGSFIFPPLVIFLLNNYALQGTFLIMSSGILNVLVAALLLIGPKKVKFKTPLSGNFDKQLQNQASDRDSNDHQKSPTDQPYFIEASEMWKKNMYIAYMASQDEMEGNKYKQNFRHSICFANSPYFLQNLTYKPPSLGNDINSEGFHLRNRTSRYDDTHHKGHFFHKLLKVCENKLPEEKDSDRILVNRNSCHSFHFGAQGINTDCLHPIKYSTCGNLPNNLDSLNRCAKPVWKKSRACSKRHIQNKLPFRTKLKAKFKLKLQKLKKILVVSLLKHKSPFLKEFVQTENVKLTSYRKLQPFLCSSAPSVFIPSKCIYFSLPQNILGVKCSINDASNSSLKSVLTLQYGAKTRERLNSLPVLGINDQRKILPVFHGSSVENSNYLVLSETNCESNMIQNCCNISTNKRQNHVREILSADKDSTCYCTDGNVQNICRNRDLEFSRNVLNLSPELLLIDKTEFKERKRKDSLSGKSTKSGGCFLDWLHMFRDPVFIIIGFTMSIQTFILVCVVTTIEDYARDVGIPENKTHYALMALSIANLVGTLTLGSITDRGYLSRQRFMCLCFLGMSVCLVAVSLLASSLPSLLSLVVIYGLMESGVIITFPLLTKEFVKGQRRQAIAIASSNVLSAPTIMLVPLLIGYFRDYIGSYMGLFQLLGATSLTCSFLWLLTPSICRRGKLKKKLLQLSAVKC